MAHLIEIAEPLNIIVWVSGKDNETSQERWDLVRVTIEKLLGRMLPTSLNGRHFLTFDANWNALTLAQAMGGNDTFAPKYRRAEFAEFKVWLRWLEQNRSRRGNPELAQMLAARVEAAYV